VNVSPSISYNVITQSVASIKSYFPQSDVTHIEIESLVTVVYGSQELFHFDATDYKPYSEISTK